MITMDDVLKSAQGYGTKVEQTPVTASASEHLELPSPTGNKSGGITMDDVLKAAGNLGSQSGTMSQVKNPAAGSYESMILPQVPQQKTQEQIQREAELRNYAAQMQQRDRESKPVIPSAYNARSMGEIEDDLALAKRILADEEAKARPTVGWAEFQPTGNAVYSQERRDAAAARVQELEAELEKATALLTDYRNNQKALQYGSMSREDAEATREKAAAEERALIENGTPVGLAAEANYYGRKVWGALQTAAEGSVNAGGYMGQSAAMGGRYQGLNNAQQMYEKYGTKEWEEEVQRLQAEIKKQQEEGLQRTVDFGTKYEQATAEKWRNPTKGQQLAGNVLGGAAGMVPSILSNAIVPGSGLYVMAAQAFGNAVAEAKDNGASDQNAIFYGAAVAAVECVTEKIFDGVAGIYGKGAADDFIEETIKNAVSNPTAQKAINELVDMLGEGFEEWISEYADAYLDKLFVGADDRDFAEISKDALGAAAIGALTSAVMKTGGAVVAQMRPAAAAAAAAAGQKIDDIKQQTAQKRYEGTGDVQEITLPTPGTAEQTETAKNINLPTPEEAAQQTAGKPAVNQTQETEKAAETAETKAEEGKNIDLPKPETAQETKAESIELPEPTQRSERRADETYDDYIERLAEEDDALAREERKERDEQEYLQERAEREGVEDAEAAYEKAEREGKAMERPQTKPAPKSRTDLKTRIQQLFNIQEGQKAEVNRIIDDIADTIQSKGKMPTERVVRLFETIYNRGTVTQEADSYFQELRKSVKGSRIYVSPELRAEFGDDWKAFAARARANGITLTSDINDRGIDGHTAQLAQMFGSLDTEADGRTQLENLVEAAENGKPQTMTQAEIEDVLRGQYGEEAVRERMDKLEAQFRQLLDNFAQVSEIEGDVRAKAEEQIRKVKENAKDVAKRQMQQKALRELQDKTMKSLQWLKKNRNKAPAALKAQYDAVLGDIDLIAVNAANEMHIDNATGKTWKDLVDMYEWAMDNDPNFLPSKELEKIMARVKGSKIGDMDMNTLENLYKAASGLRTEYYNRNNVIGSELGETFQEAYHAAVDEIQGSKGSKMVTRKSGTKVSALDRFLNFEQLTPMNVLKRMAGWKKGTFAAFARGLETGERDYKRFVTEQKKKMGEFLEKNKEWAKKADGRGKDAIWYKVEVPELAGPMEMGEKPVFGGTKTVWMTPAQKVYLALEAENYDNLRHMTGGRTFADKALYSQGNTKLAYEQGTTVKLAPETVKALVKDMTPQERELYNLLKTYFNVDSKAEINRVSNIVYGYDKAMNDNYARIFTNHDFQKTEIGKSDASVTSAGSLKERQVSKAASLNMSAFDAFTRHVDETGRFVGYAIPVENFTRLWNWGGNGESLKHEISKKWAGGNDYIQNLMERLQTTQIDGKGMIDTEVSKMLSRYVSATFGANPGIVVKQFMSYPQFAARLGWDTMPKPGQFAQVDRDLISKYTAELDYRMLGYATPEAAAMTQNKSGITETKVGNFVLGGGSITGMDGFTVSRAWPWAENYVRKNFPDLKKGSKADVDAGKSPYYQKVAEVFNDAVATTQPMYDTMHRANIMTQGGAFTRAFTMFKTVPLQQYNSLRLAFGELEAAKASGKKADIQTAQKTVANTVTATLVSAAGLEVVEILNALLKNGAKKYRDDDGELTFESIAGQMLKGTAGDLAGMVIGGSELSEAIISQMTGGKWYGIEVPGEQQLNEIIDAVKDSVGLINKFTGDAMNLAKEGGDLAAYLRKNGGDYAGAIKELAKTASTYIGGMPASNIEKYLMGMIRTTAPELYTEIQDAFNSPGKADLKGLSENERAVRVSNIMEERFGDVPKETAQEISRLYGVDPRAMPTDTPTSLTIDDEDVKLTTTQQQVYETAFAEAAGNALRNLNKMTEGMSDEAKVKYLNELYAVAKEHAKDAALDDYEPKKKLDDLERIGLSAAEAAELYAAKSAMTDFEFANWMNTKYDAPKAKHIAEIIGESTRKYDSFVDAGLDQNAILKIEETFSGLKEANGGGSVSDYQKMRALFNSGIGADNVDKALAAMMSEAHYEQYQEAKKHGVGVDYIDLLEYSGKAEGVKDEKGNTINGSVPFNVMEWLDEQKLTDEEKGWLFASMYPKAENMWQSRYRGEDFEAYYYMSESEREKYWEYCSDMTATRFSIYETDISGYKTIYDENGKEITSKKEQVVDYINRLQISTQQKNALFLCHYEESGLKGCPWYDPYEGLQLPKP